MTWKIATCGEEFCRDQDKVRDRGFLCFGCVVHHGPGGGLDRTAPPLDAQPALPRPSPQRLESGGTDGPPAGSPPHRIGDSAGGPTGFSSVSASTLPASGPRRRSFRQQPSHVSRSLLRFCKGVRTAGRAKSVPVEGRRQTVKSRTRSNVSATTRGERPTCMAELRTPAARVVRCVVPAAVPSGSGWAP